MTASAPPWSIQPLSKQHDRKSFTCEQPSLTTYLTTQASQDTKRLAARIFVATAPGDNRVLGFYTLNAYAVDLSAIADEQARLFAPYARLNATLIGRLARDSSQARKGLGEFLLSDALSRAAYAATLVASAAVIVDALDDTAASFYRHFGFIPLRDQPHKLFLPMRTIHSAFD